MMIFPGMCSLMNRFISLRLGLSSASNFATQISELKRVINDFKSNDKNIKPMSVLDLDSRLFIITNAMDSVLSYLRISNTINQKYKISSYQKLMSLNLHMLKLTIEESKIVKLIQSAIREIEKKNYFEIRNSVLDEYIKKVLVNLEKIEEILGECLLKKNLWNKCKNLFFNDTFGSLYQFKIELINRFNCQEFKVTTDDKVNLDCLLIRANNILSESNSNEESKSNSKPNSRPRSKPNSRENSLTNVMENIVLNPNNLNLNTPNTPSTSSIKNNQEKEKSVMIICGPNAAPYEVFAFSDKWIEYYLDCGVSVLLWNYRGYGESEGSVDFENMRSDAAYVADFLRKFYKFTKIGVHGISIGGIPACHLAGKNIVNLCFADRTFSSINQAVKTVGPYLGEFLHFVYPLFFFKSSDNVDSYLNSSAIKILSCDPEDNIIYEISSLKSGISQKVIQNFKTNNFFDVNGDNNSGISNSSNELLKLIFNNETEYNDFYSSISHVLERIKFHNLDKKISPYIETSSNNAERNNINYDKLNEDYANLQTKELDVVLNTEDNIRYRDESKVLLSLKNTIEKFDSAGDSLLSMTKLKFSKSKKLFLNNFFSNLLVWGSYRIGNVIASEKLIIFRAVSKKFYLLIQKIMKIISQPKKYTITDTKTTNSLKKLLEGLIKIETTFNKILFKNYRRSESLNISTDNNKDSDINISSRSFSSFDDSKKADQDEVSISTTNEIINMESYRSAQLSDTFAKLNTGNLIPLQCGHNGLYSHSEIELLSLYLLNSKFIN